MSDLKVFTFQSQISELHIVKVTKSHTLGHKCGPIPRCEKLNVSIFKVAHV